MRKLRRLRAEKGLTMDALEERTGVSKRTISELERGMRAPQALTLAKIAGALGVDIDELLQEEEAPKAQAPPSQPLDVEEERRETQTILFHSWAIALEELRDRLRKLLDNLPEIPDNKEGRAVWAARIEGLIKEFYSLQHALNSSGDPRLMWPYVEAMQSREHIPDDLYEAITRYQEALKTLNLDLFPRAQKWEKRAKEILDGLEAAEPEAVSEEETSEQFRK